MALGRHNGAPLISKAGTQWIRRVLGGHRGLSGKVSLRLMGAYSFSCFTYSWGLVSFFFKGPRWNLPERTLFEDLFVVTVFSDPFTEVSLSTTTCCRKTEFGPSAHGQSSHTLTWSREVPTLHGLWFPPALDPWGHSHALVCFRVSLLSLKCEGHLFRWMLAFPGVFSRTSCSGSFSVLSFFMLCFYKTSFVALVAFSSLSLHCFLKI